MNARPRKIEAPVSHALTIDTLGDLAGTVAHDFNNLLTAIIGHTELLSEYFAPDDPRASEIAGILHATELATTLTRQLLAFSRKQVLQPASLDLNDLIARTRPILGRVLGEAIELVSPPARPVRSVHADAAQMEQILLNLALNARDAMPHGGRIWVSTADIDIGPVDAARLGFDAGAYVELSVTDTGTGIDETVQAHLFEPFVTTKERSRGTGLGLATVYGIVKQSGGHIAVETTAGQGTTFRIYLPATADAPEGRAARARHRAADSGTETVLLVESDSGVRGLIQDVLQRRGYRVLVADAGHGAPELVSSHGAVDLLITGVVVEDMNGSAVADSIRALCPAVRVLYVSEYADGTAVPFNLQHPPAGLLQKPFTPDALARKVRAVLGDS